MDPETDVVLLPENQFWVLVVGAIMPVATYLLNRIPAYRKAPESFKGMVHTIVAAVAGGLFSVIANDVHGADNIAQQCFSAVVASLFAHNYLWKPANVNVKLGARPSPTQTPRTLDEAPAAAAEPSPAREVPGVAPAGAAREVA
jgi:hypothetical protein